MRENIRELKSAHPYLSAEDIASLTGIPLAIVVEALR